MEDSIGGRAIVCVDIVVDLVSRSGIPLRRSQSFCLGSEWSIERENSVAIRIPVGVVGRSTGYSAWAGAWACAHRAGLWPGLSRVDPQLCTLTGPQHAVVAHTYLCASVRPPSFKLQALPTMVGRHSQRPLEIANAHLALFDRQWPYAA